MNDILEGSRCGAIPHRAPIDAIEGTLADFLATRIAALDAVDPELGVFARTARDLVLGGGKRLRPTFAYWGWRGLAGPHASAEPLLPAFAALELMHAFALVHDDVMDESDTRRGVPTAHRIFAGQHRRAGRLGDRDRFGSSAAILLGDLFLVWADQLLARTALPPAVLLRVRDHYDRMRLEAVAGQYLDVLGESAPDTWSVDRALLVARLKTASYTVRSPLQFGLALAGTCADLDETYRVYGTSVGEAYQLADDLLGTFGDPAVTGKSAHDDLRNRKPTTLMMIAHRLADDAQRAELTTESPARLARVIATTGAPDRLRDMIRERVGTGVAALDTDRLHADARHALTGLAVTATDRAA